MRANPALHVVTALPTRRGPRARRTPQHGLPSVGSVASRRWAGKRVNGEPDLWIGGQWRHASDGGTRQTVNPADGGIAAVVDEATADDARDAVAAARAAFD